MRHDLVDMTGQRFGKWRVLRYVGDRKWLCRCACGTQKRIYGFNLRRQSSTCCARCHPHPQRADLTGQQFGFLKVRRYAGKRRWLCICKCGAARKVYGPNLTGGYTRGCGGACTRAKHGGSRTSEYRIWYGIKERCLNPKRHEYPYYGGRGITVCQRWQENFANFRADMGPRPSEVHSVERIDNNGHYSPENCRWATAKEQRANQRPHSIEEELGIA